MVGAPVVEPVRDPSRFDLPRVRVPREGLERQTVVDDPADLHTRAVGQAHAGVVVETLVYYSFLLVYIVDDDVDGARTLVGLGKIAERLRHELRMGPEIRV